MKLLITEKRDQAEKLAALINCRSGQGCYVGKFEGEDITIVWASGHLVTLQEPNEVVEGLPWDDPSALLPIPQSFPLKIVNDSPGKPAHAQARAYLSNIKKYLDKGVAEIILSTDSDREGEAIGWYVMRYLKYSGPVRRLWLAAGLDNKSLTDALANLRDPSVTKSWYRAAEARGRSDWAYMMLVRAYTHYGSYSVFGKNLGQGSGRSRVISVGRVQTPSLGLIVRRDNEIDNFVSKDHFRISAFFATNGAGNLEATYNPRVTEAIIDRMPEGVSWEPSKKLAAEGAPDPLDLPLFTGKKQVDAFKARLMAASSQAIIMSYAEGSRKESPPKTFSQTDAQIAIAKECKISGDLAATIIEDLYEQGWLSYARTGNSELPTNLYEPKERNGLLNSLLKLPQLEAQAKLAMDIHNGSHDQYQPFMPPVFSSKPLEHHGIVPTHQVMTPEAFNNLRPAKQDAASKQKHTTEHMQKSYLAVVKQFVQALLPPAQYSTQTVMFSVPVEDIVGNPDSVFRTKGESMVDPGWTSAFSSSDKKPNIFPPAKRGDAATINDVSLKSAKTKPPSRYTDADFGKALENVGKEVKDAKLRKILKDSKGIGTPATRKTILPTLIAREYIEIKKGVIYSTAKGRDLIKITPEWMSAPETTALWEDYLEKICEQKNDDVAVKMRDEFVGRQIGNIENLIGEMITKYSGNLGPKIMAGPSKVSDKMKNAIKSIAQNKGITLPKGILTNPKMASDFLGEHMSNNGGSGDGGAPSPAQVKFAENIISGLPANTKLPDNIWTNRNVCSKFINDNKPQQAEQPIKPPSEAQIKFANNLIEKLPKGKKAPANVLTDAAACSAFIKQQINKK